MVDTTLPTTETRLSRRLGFAGYALGFGIGGFFDGILLHQVLQWHHLLSGLEEARQNLGFLIMTDGLFHALMYVVCGFGLWLLWSGRKGLSEKKGERKLLSNAVIGFGLWHVFDTVLSHWILGIHRVRMDAENPLLWDLLWFGAFGLVPLGAGWLLGRSETRGGDRRVICSPIGLVLAVAIAGPLAAVPAPNDGTVLVLFRPDTSPQQALAAIRSIEGSLLWVDASEQLWAINLPEASNGFGLYGKGAMLVSNSILAAGCLNWVKA